MPSTWLASALHRWASSSLSSEERCDNPTSNCISQLHILSSHAYQHIITAKACEAATTVVRHCGLKLSRPLGSRSQCAAMIGSRLRLCALLLLCPKLLAACAHKDLSRDPSIASSVTGAPNNPGIELAAPCT
jgi:hypothetical protein